MYLAMGCAVFSVWNQVVEGIPLMALRLLIGGGMAYIFGEWSRSSGWWMMRMSWGLTGECAAGIVFFILGEVKPIFHTVWHIFVMIGSLLHWFCIYHYIVVIDIAPPLTM
jgi:hemolysin III